MSTEAQPSGLAVVLSGGGARAAYQVGVLRVLAQEMPECVPDILTGVSAGGINAAFLAAHQASFEVKVEQLAGMWERLRIDDVFRVDLRDLASRTLRWGGRLLSGGKAPMQPAKSLVDTSPLRTLLDRELQADGGVVRGIQESLAQGWLRAFALTGSSYSTGQSVTWAQTRGDVQMPSWERPQRRSEICAIRVDHVMASAALPFLFPAIEVDGSWYGDGGIRLTAPLSPAIHLGARRIIAVSTRYAGTRREANQPQITAYPPPSQVAGALYNAIFLDQLDADALHLHRLNQLIDAQPEDTRSGLRHVGLFVLRPSQDLGRLANEYEADLPRAFRFLTRGLGTREAHTNDMLSLVMFQTDYVRRLIEMGERDGRARLPELRAFLAA